MGNLPSQIKYDLTGKRFGRLVVIEYANVQDTGNTKWTVRCDCGRIKNVEGRGLRAGTVQSCGCLRQEKKKAEREQKHQKTAELMKKMKQIKSKPIPEKKEITIVRLEDYIGTHLRRYGNTVIGERPVRKYGKSSIIKSVYEQFGLCVTMERTLNDTLVLKVKENKHDKND